MIKRLIVLTVVLIVLSVGSAFAAQMGGMVSGDNNPALPANLRTFIDPGGLGDALVYPYYNVRENKVTYFNIVNTDTFVDPVTKQGRGVIVKLRFREAATIKGSGASTVTPKTGCQANVNGPAAGANCAAGPKYAPNQQVDCGSNEVLDFNICLSHGDVYTGAIMTDTATGAAKFVPLDTDTLTNPIVPVTGVVFKYGADNPIKTITADNTREGYFEVLSFGVWVDMVSTDNGVTFHDNPDCTGFGTLPGSFGNPDAPNRLAGIAFINDEDVNATYAYYATAIANCRSTTFGVTLANDAYTLADCQDSAVTTDLDNVDWPLTKVNMGQFYITESSIGASTAFVITFPTRKLNDTLDDGWLFSNPVVIFEVWDDKENKITSTSDFSPQTIIKNSLPHEVNVLNISHGAMFVSDVAASITTGTFTYGWIAIDMTGGDVAGDCISDTEYYGAGAINLGLPAIGLVFQNVKGDAVTWALPMAYATNINGTTSP
jgi:hypothetical protein